MSLTLFAAAAIRRVATAAPSGASRCRRLLCTSASADSADGIADTPRQSPLASRSSAEALRYTHLGGDHNQVTLLGTVTSVKDKELNKDSGAETYTVLHVATLFRYKDSISGRFRSLISRHQVTTFNPNLVKVARQVAPGDRVFVSGRMEYFYSGKVRVATVQATRIVPMLPKLAAAVGGPDEAAQGAGRWAGDDGDEREEAATNVSAFD